MAESVTKRLLLVNSVASIVADVLNVAILLWAQQYLLRRIPPAEFSLYPVLMSFMAVVRLSSIVLNSGVGRYITVALAREQPEDICETVSSMTFVSLVGAVGLIGVTLLGLGYTELIFGFESNYVPTAQLMLVLLVGSFAMNLAVVPFQGGLFAKQRFVQRSVIEVVSQLVRVLLLLVLLLVWGPRVVWVAVSFAASSVLRTILITIFSVRAVPAIRFRYHAIRWRRVGELVSFGSWNLIRWCGNTIKNAADPLILNHLAAPMDVACFHTGSLFYKQSIHLWNIVGNPISPAMTQLYATDQHERVRRLYLRGSRYALWITLALALPLLVYRRELFDLYLGSDFRAAATVLMLLTLIVPVEMAHSLMARTVYATGRVKEHGIRLMVLQVINVGITLLLVGYWGMGAVGSALATFLVVTMGYPVILWPFALRMINMSWARWFQQGVLPGLWPGLCGLAGWVGVWLVYRPTSWLTLILCGLFGLVIYAMAIWAFGMQPADRNDLSTVVAKVKTRFSRSNKPDTPLSAEKPEPESTPKRIEDGKTHSDTELDHQDPSRDTPAGQTREPGDDTE